MIKSNLSCFAGEYKVYSVELISVSLLLAASIKSAQIIGHL
jgi:hypothetical protein